MEPKVDEMEASLRQQLSDLADQIRTSETNLLILKEGYLKVQGALEMMDILKKQKEDAEAVSLANM